MLLHFPTLLVRRKFVAARPNDRSTFFVRLFHQFSGILSHSLANAQVLDQDRVGFLAVGPDFIVRARGGGLTFRLRLAIAVQSHDGTKSSPLEPPDQQLAKSRIFSSLPLNPPSTLRHAHNQMQSHNTLDAVSRAVVSESSRRLSEARPRYESTTNLRR